MKVIFLDFDGVINDLDSNNLVNEKFVNELKKIIENTDAKIVVSSSRKNEFMGNKEIKHEESECYMYFEKVLIELGVNIYDYTPFVNVDRSIRKECEISSYLESHPEIEEFIIIDDDYIINKFKEHQVFIEYASGILPEHVKPAIDILNGNLGFYPPNYNYLETLEERFARILEYKSKNKS